MEHLTDQVTELEVPVAKTTGARCPELENVRQVMNFYIDGVRNGNISSFREAFHPKASAFGWTGKDVYTVSLQEFCDVVATLPVPAKTGEPISFFINSIRITGNAATVEMAMDSYIGHNFVDYFQLLKIEGRWWIVSKLWHADPQSSK